MARKAIRQAQSTWFQVKANEGQRGRFGVRVEWKYIGICKGLARQLTEKAI